MSVAQRRPIILGLVGDSAAGKTTLTQGLMSILGRECVTHVCTDDYHKHDRQERARLGITPLHPDCNYMDIMELQIERLHYGQPILKPVYDHAAGTLVRPKYVQPREFVIVEGLLGFATPVLEQFYDVKVYLDRTESHHSHPLALTQLLLTYHLLRKHTDTAHLPFAAPVAALSRLGMAGLQPGARLAAVGREVAGHEGR